MRKEVIERLARVLITRAQIETAAGEAETQYRQLLKDEARGGNVDSREISRLRGLAAELTDKAKATDDVVEEITTELRTTIATEKEELAARLADLRPRFVSAGEKALPKLAKELAGIMDQTGAKLEGTHAGFLQLHFPILAPGPAFAQLVEAARKGPPEGSVPLLKQEIDELDARLWGWDAARELSRAVAAAENLAAAR